MRRKITVYGLRFSKTTFWNRINTGFLDSAVATVLTACGIETDKSNSISLPLADQSCNSTYRLRYWNRANKIWTSKIYKVATVLTACGIETIKYSLSRSIFNSCCNSTYRLRYWNGIRNAKYCSIDIKMRQCLPFSVLKPVAINSTSSNWY